MNIDDLIREWVAGIDGDITVSAEAQKLVAQAREKFPDDLAVWLDERAESIVGERLGEVLRSLRATAQRRRSSRVFAEIAAQVETGEIDLPLLDTRYVIEGSYRALRMLTHADLEIVAAGYEQSVRENAFEAAYLRAIQKRLPKNNTRTVGEVLDDKTIARIRSGV